jgi:hypothetical protein
LVWDNRARDYERAPLAEKRALFQLAWGDGRFGQVGITNERSNLTGRSCTALANAEWTSSGELEGRR